MRKAVPVLVAVCALLVVASSAALAADNWIGTWKLDPAMSKYSSASAPKTLTLKFEATAAGTRLTSDGVGADGKPMHAEYTTKYDGKEVAWTGNPSADTATAKKIDDWSYENVWKMGGKVTITAKVVVAKDGKTLTVTQTGTDAKGQAVNVTAVYRRQ